MNKRKRIREFVHRKAAVINAPVFSGSSTRRQKNKHLYLLSSQVQIISESAKVLKRPF